MTRESYCGFHFISTFTNCRRKFFYKYRLKWIPIFVSPALSEGAAIHEGIATFYLTGDIKAALDKAMQEIHARKDHYEYADRFRDGCDRVELIVRVWLESWAQYTKDTYKVLHVEELREILIPDSNYILTIRPDVELEHIERQTVHVLDTKTSGWGLKNVYDSFSSQQQGTCYLFGLQFLPEYAGRVLHVLPDAVYQRNAVVQCERKLEIYKTQEQLRSFGTAMQSILDEMYLGAKIFDGDPSPTNLDYFYYRQPTCDGGQEWKCEYKAICDQAIREQPYTGYKLDDRPFVDVLRANEGVA